MKREERKKLTSFLWVEKQKEMARQLEIKKEEFHLETNVKSSLIYCNSNRFFF